MGYWPPKLSIFLSYGKQRRPHICIIRCIWRHSLDCIILKHKFYTGYSKNVIILSNFFISTWKVLSQKKIVQKKSCKKSFGLNSKIVLKWISCKKRSCKKRMDCNMILKQIFRKLLSCTSRMIYRGAVQYFLHFPLWKLIQRPQISTFSTHLVQFFSHIYFIL